MTIDAPRDAKGAAAALEAYFLRRVLSEVQPGEAMGGTGFAGSTFHDMFNDALADQMAQSGGVGLAAQITAQLTGQGPDALPPMAAGVLPVRGAAARYGGASPLSVMPVVATMTSGVGDRVRHGELQHHKGVDLAASYGSPVRAAGPGRVIRAERAGTYGNLVVVDHGGGLETRYAHLSKIDVQEGDRIDAGVVVGEVGSTGNSAGPHLHFEVRRDGEPVDPTRELPGIGHPHPRRIAP